MEEKLAEAGVKASDAVAVQAQPNDSMVLALLAVRLAGHPAVPIHPRLLADEAQRLLESSGARAYVGPGGPDQAAGSPSVTPVETEVPGPSTEYLVHTSATQGRPKGVLLSEQALRWHAGVAARRLDCTPGDRSLLLLTPAHVGGLAMVIRCAEIGMDLVVSEDATGRRLEEAVQRYGITHLSLVPTQLGRWLDARADGPPPSSLRSVLVGGASCPPALVARARAAGLPVQLSYGLTEAASQVATSRAASPPGSCGMPLDGVEVRIAPGAIGEILVRSPALMAGYHRDSEATARVLRGGWLATGDRGRLDPEGNLHVLGRIDDLIITGGENVDPDEVEAALRDHPGVVDAAVAGVPDPEWGAVVTAWVVPRPDRAADADALRQHCSRRLAPFKVPHRFEFVPEIPRTANGKVLRRQLRLGARADDADVRVGDPAR